MTSALRRLRIGFIERLHPPGHRGSVTYHLLPLLRECGARVELVHAEQGLHRLDAPPPWDLVVLKSGSAAALHVATAAEAWGVPSVNRSEATRLAQDRLASAVLLRRAGLPVARARLAWLGSTSVRRETATLRPVLAGAASGAGHEAYEDPTSISKQLEALTEQPLIVKAARGSCGVGLWAARVGELPALAERVPEGPYLLMDWVSHAGDDLKIFVAGEWMAAIERPFPAATYEDKLGHPARLPDDVAEAPREAGRILGLTCFGCDFVRGPDGWTLIDVNAFPGYKGADGAAEALVAEIRRVAKEEVL